MFILDDPQQRLDSGALRSGTRTWDIRLPPRDFRGLSCQPFLFASSPIDPSRRRMHDYHDFDTRLASLQEPLQQTLAVASQNDDPARLKNVQLGEEAGLAVFQVLPVVGHEPGGWSLFVPWQNIAYEGMIQI